LSGKIGPLRAQAPATLQMDMRMKTMASTMVSWKRAFSAPRRVRKKVELPPKAPPKPDPRAWRRITKMRVRETTISTMLR
jgi:hypothetical protein